MIYRVTCVQPGHSFNAWSPQLDQNFILLIGSNLNILDNFLSDKNLHNMDVVRPCTVELTYCGHEKLYTFKADILKCIFLKDIFVLGPNISLKLVPGVPIDNMSELFQVMIWRLRATSQYLNQCWPRLKSLYGYTRSQWVKYCFDLCNIALQLDVKYDSEYSPTMNINHVLNTAVWQIIVTFYEYKTCS